MSKITRLLTSIFKTTLTKFAKYLLALVDKVEKDELGSNKYKSIRKSENKIIEILAKSKIRNLPKFKSINLSMLKNVQVTSAIKKTNFLISGTRVDFTKLY